MEKQHVAQRTISVALCGNPNSGKTTLFNELTGSRQEIGNWPGVTVERKEGWVIFGKQAVRVVDLPGTYSLGAHSEDERITREYILSGEADVVVNVVDATNLERNLYLTVQLREMGIPLVVALNMYDELERKQVKIDTVALSERLGVPVVPTVALRGKGVKELLEVALAVAENKDPGYLCVDYGPHVEEDVRTIEEFLRPLPSWERYARWLAVRVLEGDEEFRQRLSSVFLPGVLDRLEGKYDPTVFVEKRYAYIARLLQGVVACAKEQKGPTLSDRIDAVVTNKYLGMPIFLLLMWGLFQFVFRIGGPLVGWIEGLFGWLKGMVAVWFEEWGMPPLVRSLITDGVIEGVGAVLVFVPHIFLLFLAIAFLEDSGYMARAAYIMDRLMHPLGLHGKSFIPLLLGFGCNVPAIMATRTLENRKDRLATILVVPFMSCSARFPVYVLFAGTFFAKYQGLVVFSLYLLGIILAVGTAFFLSRVLFVHEPSYFVLELPPYRMPTLKTIALHMWNRGVAFLRKAGSLIAAVVVLVWILANLPPGTPYAGEGSFLGIIGQWIAPVFSWAGFGHWRAGVALLFGILAKEVVVGALGTLYGVGEEALAESIAQDWTPLAAYAFMVMTLVYIPCVATLAAIRRETNSWGWTAFAAGYSLLLGWFLAVAIFQLGKVLHLG
ncbi:ferrous iron transport protein B [Candidatus Caldatribacterium sp.]|uniref:ferrous iron transport protein B n=1 Tax=Candidatus Caldatribacterium sp. TaxID=2282143 RepID=UPI002993739D|nr:ferrous iron transport protein B [Candidatus Caldatribacterium sp.]MDW8081876.1 ferrous iron transport protein B [Candidatus Calescibacterium sp.]